MGDLLLPSQLTEVRIEPFDEDQALAALDQFDAAQYGCGRLGLAVLTNSHSEVIMSTPELSEAAIGIPVPATVQAEPQTARANQRAANFTFGAQKLILEELVFAGNAMRDRTQTEMHLFSEFTSKLAGAHSVRDIKAMYEECGKHQIEFFRRDCDRLFKHGERMIEAASSLFQNHPLD
jgi:hypothetical protein